MSFEEYLTSLQGKTVGVIGVGVSNRPLIEKLLERGIDVTARDKKENLGELGQALTAQGVEKVVFITTGATSAFRPADLTAYKDEAPFVLTHDGETVTFTAGETDLASLLLQA